MERSAAEVWREGRGVISEDLQLRYHLLKEREADLERDRELFYRDVAKLVGRFSVEGLAARLYVTRDAVYQWARKGRIAEKRANKNAAAEAEQQC